MKSLSLSTLRTQNVKRCLTAFKKSLDDWSPAEWGCATAGETGELCNKLKKLLRGESVPTVEIADEAADVLIYLDLLCAALDIDLAAATVRKFNKVSRKKKSKIFLELE